MQLAKAIGRLLSDISDAIDDAIETLKDKIPFRPWYHYTDVPEDQFVKGVRGGTWFTDDPTYTAQEASEKLGIRRPDKMVIVLAKPGEIVPGKPYIVGPNKFGPGGGRQFYNPLPLPGSRATTVVPVK